MKRKDYIIFIIVLIVMAILVLLERIAIPCIFNKVTGLYCPGCGITRAIRALVKGDIRASFRNNILLYTVFPVIFILEIIKKRYRKSEKFKKVYKIIIIILLVFVIIFGVLRNIPGFEYLAPIEP